jgi:hypothetical protein
MHSVAPRYLLAALLLQFCMNATAGTITAAPKPTSTDSGIPSSIGTCEARTINYITDSLPQLCLKNSWRSENITGGKVTTEGAEVVADAIQSVTSTESPAATATTAEVQEPASTDLETGELNDASFLSFEEWKKQTLEKAGPVGIGGRKEVKKRDGEGLQNNLEGLGEEGEIEVDFGVFGGGGKDEKQAENEGEERLEEEVTRSNDQYMSKDAGKTCKERFSYASFDAGATILKTHQGAKNSKAVLIENKDSYMLSECSVENKFIIIELSVFLPFPFLDTSKLTPHRKIFGLIQSYSPTTNSSLP